MSLSRWSLLSRGLVEFGEFRRRCDHRVPDEPWLAHGWVVPPRPRSSWNKLRVRGRLSSRRRRVRRRVLRQKSARGARDGPAAAIAAGALLGGAGTRRPVT